MVDFGSGIDLATGMQVMELVLADVLGIILVFVAQSSLRLLQRACSAPKHVDL